MNQIPVNNTKSSLLSVAWVAGWRGTHWPPHWPTRPFKGWAEARVVGSQAGGQLEGTAHFLYPPWWRLWKIPGASWKRFRCTLASTRSG